MNLHFINSQNIKFPKLQHSLLFMFNKPVTRYFFQTSLTCYRLSIPRFRKGVHKIIHKPLLKEKHSKIFPIRHFLGKRKKQWLYCSVKELQRNLQVKISVKEMTKLLWGHWKEHEKLKIFEGISAGNALVWHRLLNGQGSGLSSRGKQINGIPSCFFSCAYSMSYRFVIPRKLFLRILIQASLCFNNCQIPRAHSWVFLIIVAVRILLQIRLKHNL